MNQNITSLFQRIGKRLHQGAARMLHSDEEADDVVQDAFVRLWQHRESISTPAHAEGFVATAVRNICIDKLRRKEFTVSADSAQDLVSGIEDCSRSDDNDDVISNVMRLIESELTVRDRQILLMRDRSGCEFSEIAAEFGISETAVRMALSRARKTIRNIYRQQYGNEN